MLKTLRISLFIFGCLSCFTVNAQKNFQPGYILNHQGDTIQGYIDYRNWEENPEEIHYSSSLNGSPITYLPKDIAEFGVQDEIYVSAIVDIMPVETTVVDETPEMYKKRVNVFLQTLIRGEKSLYYHDSQQGYQNFYIVQDSSFQLLEYKKTVQYKNGSRVKVESKKYVTQLAYYLRACDNIESMLKYSGYGKKSLIKLFENYYDCTQSTNAFQKEEEKTYTEIGVLAGITTTRLSFVGSPRLDDANFDTNTGVSLGIFFDVVLPRNNRKWSINNEILYTSTYSVSDSFRVYDDENDYSRTYSELAYSYLKVNNMVRFKYPLNKSHIYFNVGMSNGFALHETNYEWRFSKFYSRETIEEGKVFEDTRRHEQAILLGTGIKFNKLSFELRFERGNGMSSYSYINSRTRRFNFLAAYKF